MFVTGWDVAGCVLWVHGCFRVFLNVARYCQVVFGCSRVLLDVSGSFWACCWSPWWVFGCLQMFLGVLGFLLDVFGW